MLRRGNRSNPLVYFSYFGNLLPFFDNSLYKLGFFLAFCYNLGANSCITLSFAPKNRQETLLRGGLAKTIDAKSCDDTARFPCPCSNTCQARCSTAQGSLQLVCATTASR